MGQFGNHFIRQVFRIRSRDWTSYESWRQTTNSRNSLYKHDCNGWQNSSDCSCQMVVKVQIRQSVKDEKITMPDINKIKAPTHLHKAVVTNTVASNQRRSIPKIFSCILHLQMQYPINVAPVIQSPSSSVSSMKQDGRNPPYRFAFQVPGRNP